MLVAADRSKPARHPTGAPAQPVTIPAAHHTEGFPGHVRKNSAYRENRQ
jgi:hypothetical protein